MRNIYQGISKVSRVIGIFVNWYSLGQGEFALGNSFVWILSILIYETSYFPSTLKLWNDLNTETCNIPTLLQFKSSIRHQPPREGEYLSVGERKYNIILTRIRHRCSSLNADLFHVNIVPYSNCSCGVLVENAEHYLFECTLYNTQRRRLLQTIHQIQTIPTVNFDLLTNGSTLHDFETNKQIILAVLKFIKDTNRFV